MNIHLLSYHQYCTKEHTKYPHMTICPSFSLILHISWKCCSIPICPSKKWWAPLSSRNPPCSCSWTCWRQNMVSYITWRQGNSVHRAAASKTSWKVRNGNVQAHSFLSSCTSEHSSGWSGNKIDAQGKSCIYLAAFRVHRYQYAALFI